MSSRILGVVAGLFALLALGASVAIPYWILRSATGDLSDLRIPLLAISGFLGVFACVALLVLAFGAMNLVNRDQALGMPEGSVRALLAIFLVVTLGMSALFLLGPAKLAQTPNPPSANNQKPKSPESPKATGTEQGAGTEPAAMTAATGSSFRLAALSTPGVPPRRSAASAALGTEPSQGTESSLATQPDKKQTGAKENAATTASVDQGGSDLSKQFLTLVGGLVTTVVGFYFGSQTATSSAAKGGQVATEAINRFKAQ